MNSVINKYKIKYNYKKEIFPNFEIFLIRLYERSIAYTNEQNQIGNYTEQEKEENLNMVKNLVESIEDYVFAITTNKIIDINNIFNIVEQLKKINIITVLPKQERNQNSKSVNDMIFINPNISSSKTLNKKERIMLYTFYEITRQIHSSWKGKNNESIKQYILEDVLKNDEIKVNLKKAADEEQQTYYPNLSKSDVFKNNLNSIIDGINLLDEVASQELAEFLTYKLAKKPRPQEQERYYTTPKGRQLFSGEFYTSNFDSRGELATPAIIFSKAAKSIIPDISIIDSKVLQKLSLKTLNPLFLQDLKKEFKTNTSEETNLLKALTSLGRIKDASRAVKGNSRFADSLINSKRHLNHLYETTDTIINNRQRRSKK